MRGDGHISTRLPGAKAILAGAALLAGTVFAAQAQMPESGNTPSHDETAIAVPRVAMPGGNGVVAMPQPLSPSDAVLVRRIFTAEAHGNLGLADQTIAELQDPLLLGPILAERYLGRFHRSTVAELTDWLRNYADQSDGPAIEALRASRLPKGASVPPVPNPTGLRAANRAETPAPDLDADGYAVIRLPWLEHTVASLTGRDTPQAALHRIDATRGLSATYVALLRGEVVRGLFLRNEDDEAVRLTRQIMRDPQDRRVGFAAYVGGLASWRLGDLSEAAALFETAADAPDASRWQRAAAAFWRARVAAREEDVADALPWLRRAARERTTLHGLIARRQLGLPTGIPPSDDLLSQADVDAIAATASGWRAFALLQVGQTARAAAELRGLWPAVKDDANLRRSLLLVASGAGLTDCAAQLAADAASLDGGDDPAPFAIPRLHPAGGFRIDPALVYALARLESNFDPQAISAAGARGLMQLMPVTAHYISGDNALSNENWRDPAVNLELGQRYVAYLAQQDAIDGNLIRLLASYNAGPGGFVRWHAAMHDDGDPLLFIEAIPNSETRAFVEHALTYTWIYAARLHVPAPSLEAMAADEFPRFTPGAAQGKLTAVAPRLH